MGSIGGNYNSFNISANGMSVQKKKMDLIAENIANTSTTRTEKGGPYKRKFLLLEQKEARNSFQANLDIEGRSIAMLTNNPNHIRTTPATVAKGIEKKDGDSPAGINMNVREDQKEGDKVYMPDHPDADDDGYVVMPNVDVVTEMVEMISATRSYEANLTAFNASKQMAKDSLEI